MNLVLYVWLPKTQPGDGYGVGRFDGRGLGTAVVGVAVGTNVGRFDGGAVGA